MFERSWMDAILSSLLWFFYHHLNGSSQYIRPRSSISLFHFGQKTQNNLCFTVLFRSWIRLSFYIETRSASILSWWVGMRGRRNEDVLDAPSLHRGAIFSSKKLPKTGSDWKTEFSGSNFPKRQYLVLIKDQTKNYFQTNRGSLQFICKCFFISNLFKLNEYF